MEVLGWCGIKGQLDPRVTASAELGYMLAEKHQGLGIVTTTARTVIQLAFKLLPALEVVQFQCIDSSERSALVPQRLCFAKHSSREVTHPLDADRTMPLSVYHCYRWQLE